MLVIKLAGAALVAGAGLGAGWQLARPLGRRPGELREIQGALALLETEVAYGATPLPRALGRAAAAGGLAARLFGQAAARAAAGELPGEALAGALAAAYPHCALAPADREALAALAQVLGATDRADQLKHLRLCRERLAAAEAAAEADRHKSERLYRTMGLLVGAAAAIVLI